MLYRSLLAALALGTVATDSEAGPFRRRAQTAYQPVYQAPTFVPTAVLPAGGIVMSTSPTVESTSYYTPAATTASGSGVTSASGSDGDGLEEVNALRMRRGLRPFVRDEGLTQGARACATFRANHGLFGHTSNDFAFLPAGAWASSGGCAAYPAGYGWMSCCVYDNYTYAGAAYATGRDGRRYMQLFVR